MKSITNAWLEKFEIKKPDYDYVKRDSIGLEGVKYGECRYVKDGNEWIQRNKRTENLEGKASIMFLGDITCFEKQFEQAKNGKTYDFAYEFEVVHNIFSQADLVVGNLETMIFPHAPYRTEKYVAEQNFHCNAPIEFLYAIKKAGIDVLTNANNHDLDTGAVGIGETIDNIERFGFIQTGTFKSDKKRYEIINVEGFKIAIIAFAMTHNNKKENLTSEGVNFLLNDYSKDKAKQIITRARNDGAEVIFICIHWGKEHNLTQSSAQEKIAKELAYLGADCIIGSHPHVLQPFMKLERENKTVPVFYSMGNFVSHNVKNVKSRSIIACITLERRQSNINLHCTYIPIFTSGNYGEKKYVVLPINENASDSRNIKRLEIIKRTIGNRIEINNDIKFDEYIENIEENVENKKKTKIYDDLKFTYLIYKNHVCIDNISRFCTAPAYSVPDEVIGLKVKSIKEGAFEGNQIIKKINFNKNISFISNRAFKDCVNLEGLQLGRGVKEIGEEAFTNCTNLSAVVIKSKVKRIGSKSFYNCKNLRSVKIPYSVIEIAEDAFEGCKKAVFYCEENSYAEQYAKEHGFKYINMKLNDNDQSKKLQI